MTRTTTRRTTETPAMPTTTPEPSRACQRAGCIRDTAAVVEVTDLAGERILRRALCAEDRNALVALFGRRFV